MDGLLYMYRFARPDDGLIDYAKLALFLNWRCHPVPALRIDYGRCGVDSWPHNLDAGGTLIQDVNVLALMQDLDLTCPRPHTTVEQ